MSNSVIVATGVMGGSVINSGAAIRIKLATGEQDRTVEIELGLTAIDQAMKVLSGLYIAANRAAAASNPGADTMVHAIDVVGFGADEILGADAIALILQTTGGLTWDFSIPKQSVAAVCRKLDEAAKKIDARAAPRN